MERCGLQTTLTKIGALLGPITGNSTLKLSKCSERPCVTSQYPAPHHTPTRSNHQKPRKSLPFPHYALSWRLETIWMMHSLNDSQIHSIEANDHYSTYICTRSTAESYVTAYLRFTFKIAHWRISTCCPWWDSKRHSVPVGLHTHVFVWCFRQRGAYLR